MIRSLHRALALAALLLAGCPTPSGEGGGATTASDGLAPPPAAATEPAPPPAPPVLPPDPLGPPDAFGPAPMRTPEPWEGRHQLDQLPRRTIKVGGVPVTAWIADNDPRRRLGLMHVRELPADHGMLFVYPDVRERSFWMKNTLIPLSIAYIDERGRIASILDMEPHDETPRPSGAPVRFGLEMAQGWFRAHGIEPGAQVDGITHLPGYD